MRLLNELNCSQNGIDFVGYTKMFPLNHKIDLRVGSEIYIDDFEVGKYRNMSVIDDHIKEERRISTLLKNANRRGVVSTIKRTKQVRNCGRVKFISYIIGVRLFSDNSDDTSTSFLMVSNPSFLKKCV